MQVARISQNNQTNRNSLSLPAKTQRNFSAKQSNVKFTGALPESKIFEPIKKIFKPVTFLCDKLVGGIAIGYGKLFNSKFFQNMVKKTEENKVDVVKHISAFTGLIISGLYITKTLGNDKLDPAQKTTLAVNQGIVSLTATTLGYTVGKLLEKKVDKFVRKYVAVNYKNPALKTLQGGARAAAQMMIFATMYRYVSPVLVTPIANSIGNKIQAKKEAKLAGNKPQAAKV